ncbi:DUF3320 domain-containing protein [Tautonia sociabilis]|uniref:DUF3320 domain-containing protein n=1 Tax=Tautonia sociabilis TaxID=2080755 RepID=A0A432MHQ3_9BACT|nr:DUF3320 domain-containing protein [Tautonia sociabilis]RUL86458.1 DUF3320 domain-containing protein [Tautonia sociabilis]
MSVPSAVIAERLDADRRALLDLSLRNPLLNYRPRRRGLTIVGESPVEVVRLLVREGRRMAFAPAPDRPEEGASGDRAEGEAPGVGLELPPADPTDLILQTDLPAEPLQERLLAIDAAARGSVEELGVNTLFLALGMLSWSEERNGRRVRAPLILVPVALGRSGARDRFRVRYSGEDLETNLSLSERLRAGFGIELPEIPGADDLDPSAYFDAVGAAVSGEEGWEVDREAAALGFFSFSRLLMYRDLDPSRWPEGARPSAHPVLSGLLGEGLDEGEPAIGEEEHLDDRLGPIDVRPVLDADASQTLALVDAMRGRTLVIQGPPGTGKSQTIANLIAEAVGRGKSVLFVAEKAAALEVVHRRLDAVGLGAACLELHSNRTRKRDVLDELRRTLQLGRPRVGAAEDDAKVLGDLRGRLNAFAEAVTTPIGSSGVTPHEAAGILLRERAALGGAVPPPMDVPGLAEWSAPEFRERELMVEQLQARMADLTLPADHPMRRSGRSLWTPSDRSELFRRANEARAATEAVRSAAEELAEALGIPCPADLPGSEAMAEAVRPLPKGGLPVGLTLADDSWEERGRDLDELLDSGATLARLHRELDAVLLPEAWDRDLVETREAFNTVGRRWWRWTSGRYRRAAFRLATLCRGEPPRTNAGRLALVDSVLEAQRRREAIGRFSCSAALLFGSRWRGDRSDFAELAEVARFARRVREEARTGRLPAGVIEALGDDDAIRRALPLADRLLGALARQREAIEELAAFAGIGGPGGLVGAHVGGSADRGDPVDRSAGGPVAHDGRSEAVRDDVDIRGATGGSPARDPSPWDGRDRVRSGMGMRIDPAVVPDWFALPFEELLERIEAVAEHSEHLHAVALVNQRAASCREAGLGAVVEASRSWPEAARLLATAFRARWAEALLDRAARERPALGGFSGGDHEAMAGRFARLDVAVLGHNRAWAAREHWSRLPRHQAMAGDLAVLRRELEKKTRHLPLRVLFSQAGRAVQAVKPVFLMSPLSVAAYLEPGQLAFDLVVFDEASQVRPVDALGALLRGRQAVVVGDDRQLPPTTFFDRLTAGDETVEDDDEAAGIASDALESILGLFLAQGAPRRMLRWHYRSRHESLIAVSNRAFYDGRLIVFPGPERDRSERGLVLRLLPETVYDRGRSRTNPEEARAVAEAAMAFARAQLSRPEGSRLTLGVAAFSAAQAEAISRVLERLRRDDPSCEPFFADDGPEPFFVKNLESVQGDERDAMFISVGYGRDAGGRVSMNFGPLNGEGGERRLNVLITRARLRCEVFTNLRSSDLDSSRATARGVRALKTFLRFAELGTLEDEGERSGAPAGEGSPFEEQVAEAMRAEGYEVVRGLGSSESRVDLAVVDPEHPGRYRLGVLCDGPSYSAPRSARDRERIRPAVLRGLGWRLARAWSPDWWHDPEGRLRALVAEIEREDDPPGAEPITPKAGGIARDARPSAGGPELPALPPYEAARLEVGPDESDPAALPAETLAAWVAEVVRVEGPVHETEVVRRIAEAVGLKRLAGRPKEAIERAATAPFRDGGPVRRRGAFLWPSDLERPRPRDRSALPASSRRLEYVCPEELASAVERVVADAFRVDPDDLPAAVCRLLGFPRTTDEMRARVASVVDGLLSSGRLERQGHRLAIATPADSPEDGGSGPNRVRAPSPEGGPAPSARD